MSVECTSVDIPEILPENTQTVAHTKVKTQHTEIGVKIRA